ncbi:hypothetical protein N7530_012691 [Penicillium desertorum]|uniref:Uncharacterized protein n=1 Tax=Penicillium desertorum TaxID=1303715 RepID=A0A9W9WDJ0_9EURO|nr:hypothetical protein N7530_012691 [Penicillium desertorum]
MLALSQSLLLFDPPSTLLSCSSTNIFAIDLARRAPPPLGHRRELTSPLPSFDLSSALCAALPHPCLFYTESPNMLDMRHFCLWSATPNHAEPRLCLTDTSAGQSIVDPLRPLVSVALDPLWTIACVQRVVELPWGAVRE